MPDDLDRRLRATLADGSDDARFAAALRMIQEDFGAEIGTIHRLDPDEHLHLVAASAGLPAPVLAASRRIPLGKGIAGEAAQTARPVTLCNLQTDTSGVARPGARATGAGGSLCVPILDGARVVGTLGIGWMRERAIADEEAARLTALGRVLGAAFVDAHRPGV
ncbi:MAG: GAF domain-containing protein [Deltaproteobacteria bacterium]|nr:GAF domain-containing protein [Deltaproteobacteria bacterium]